MNKTEMQEQLRIQTSAVPADEKVAKYIVLQAKMRKIQPQDMRKTLFFWHQCGDFYLADPEDMRWQTSTAPVLLVLKDGNLVDTTMPRLREQMPALTQDIRLYRKKLATDDALLQRLQEGIESRDQRIRQGEVHGDQHVIAENPALV